VSFFCFIRTYCRWSFSSFFLALDSMFFSSRSFSFSSFSSFIFHYICNIDNFFMLSIYFKAGPPIYVKLNLLTSSKFRSLLLYSFCKSIILEDCFCSLKDCPYSGSVIIFVRSIVDCLSIQLKSSRISKFFASPIEISLSYFLTIFWITLIP
jgi:hypothetical protein